MIDLGKSTKFFLKVDDESVRMLQARNYTAHWLLNAIQFKLERNNSHRENADRRAPTATATSAANSEKAGEAATNRQPEPLNKPEAIKSAEPGKGGAPQSGVKNPSPSDEAPNYSHQQITFGTPLGGNVAKEKPALQTVGLGGASQVKTATGTQKALTGSSKVSTPKVGSGKNTEHRPTEKPAQ